MFPVAGYVVLVWVWEVFGHNFITYIFYPLFSFWDPDNVNTDTLDMIPELLSFLKFVFLFAALLGGFYSTF